MTETTNQDPKDSRGRLVAAAKQLLSEIGYGAMSPRRLLDAAGVGQGSLYHHFSGKPAVAGAALEELADEMLAETDAAIADSQTGVEALRAILRGREAPEKGCRLGRLVNEEAFDDDALRAPVSRFFDGLETRAASAVARARADGTPLPKVSDAALAATIVAIVQGGFVLARARRDPAPFHRAREGALALLCPAKNEGSQE